MRIRRVIGLAAFAFCGATFGAGEREFEVTGVVRGKLDDGRPIIEHAAIPGYMEAMTMAFNVRSAEDAAFLQPGDRVAFRFQVTDRSSLADRFVVTGKELGRKATGPLVRAKLGDAVAAFELRDEAGKFFNESSLIGRYTVLTFIFTRCPVPEFCPAMAAKFASLQNAIAKEDALAQRVRLLSVTLDPEHDSPEILAAYGKAVGANGAIWNFATGSVSEIRRLGEAFGVSSKAEGGTINHSLETVLIGPDGRVAKIWSGNRWTAADAIAEIKTIDAKPSCCSRES